MYLHISKNGEIISSDKESWINIKWIFNSNFSSSEYKKSNDIQVFIDNNKLSSIITPAYFRGDIFWGATNDGVFLSDDFFTVAKKIKTVQVDMDISSYFINKGYAPQGKTLFSPINRLCSNCVYFLDNLINGTWGGAQSLSTDNNVRSKLSDFKDAEIYRIFKSTLNEIIAQTVNNKTAILLSGGIDSRLLLAVSKEYTDHITLITSLTSPYFFSNCRDVVIAENIAKITKEKIITNIIDYREHEITELDPIIKLMPFSVHSAINFHNMCKEAAKENISSVLCGQNMDALYNLGPTERMSCNIHGIAQLLKRFYLSEEYFKTLPDVIGKDHISDKIIARIGLRMFSRATKNKNITLPTSSIQLLENFYNSNDYTVFGEKDNNQYFNKIEMYTPFELKKDLFKYKLNYIKGGDSQAVEVGGYINNVKVILPYSDYRMVDFLSQVRLTRKDVLFPKRYSYMYLSEFETKYGKDFISFKEPSKKQLQKRFKGVEDLYKAFTDITEKTNWGKQMQKKAGSQARGYTGLMRYNSLLNAYWYHRLIEIMQSEYDIEVMN